MDPRKISIGQTVIYHEPDGTSHEALVTSIHCVYEDDDGVVVTPDQYGQHALLNVVWVSGNRDRQDTWGRQIERESSVVHASDGAHGNYWRFDDESPNPVKPSVT